MLKARLLAGLQGDLGEDRDRRPLVLSQSPVMIVVVGVGVVPGVLGVVLVLLVLGVEGVAGEPVGRGCLVAKPGQVMVGVREGQTGG